MAGMPELKQALVEIVAVAEKYDLGLGVTISNEDCARYLYRLPSWSIVQAAQAGSLRASVHLKDGDTVVGAYDIDTDFEDDSAVPRIRHSLHALQSSIDNMRRYADTIDSILSGVLQVLDKNGISVTFDSDPETPLAYNTLPEADGKPN